MIIRCWGARGSIPVSGKEFVKYGGDTPCIEIRTKNDEILIIDAGSGIRRLGNRLLDENRFSYNMLFTHSHWDHILGFPFFKPIYFSRTHIKMFGCPTAQGAIKKLLGDVMSPPHFPVRFEDIKADIRYQGACSESFTVDSVTINPIVLSHPNMGLGFRFTEDGKSFVFLTDNELSYQHPGGGVYEDYLEFSRGADLLIHDSEYTESEYRLTRAWGHSIYKDALDLALEAGVKQFGLYHHNQDRSDEELDAMVEDCRRIIRNSKRDLHCFAPSQDTEIIL
jgi:phosphoribosyl 1,2-cyclic phosphodiesterase